MYLLRDILDRQRSLFSHKALRNDKLDEPDSKLKRKRQKTASYAVGRDLMFQFSEILGSTFIENKSIRFAIVENLYENLFLTLNGESCGINFSQNRAPWGGPIFCKVRHQKFDGPQFL
jgi:hypothetical protein